MRHAHALELAREGVPLNIIQRQLGHANLGTTSIYLWGVDPEEIIAFEVLRDHSRAANRKLVDIAAAVVDGHPLLRSRARPLRSETRASASRAAPPRRCDLARADLEAGQRQHHETKEVISALPRLE